MACHHPRSHHISRACCAAGTGLGSDPLLWSSLPRSPRRGRCDISAQVQPCLHSQVTASGDMVRLGSGGTTKENGLLNFPVFEERWQGRWMSRPLSPLASVSCAVKRGRRSPQLASHGPDYAFREAQSPRAAGVMVPGQELNLEEGGSRGFQGEGGLCPGPTLCPRAGHMLRTL